MLTPNFITFTGADEDLTHAGLVEMGALARAYPIEWAILYSRERAGTPRYPGWRIFDALIGATEPESVAIHLCDSAAHQFLDGRVEGALGFMLAAANRVQVNVPEFSLDEETPAAADALAEKLNIDLIFQTRGAFPTTAKVGAFWLYDISAGRGISPESWPAQPVDGRAVGYAGGLNPDNVEAAVKAISAGAHDFWIDMETGVRDAGNRFDLARVRAVCEAVYGR